MPQFFVGIQDDAAKPTTWVLAGTFQLEQAGGPPLTGTFQGTVSDVAAPNPVIRIAPGKSDQT